MSSLEISPLARAGWQIRRLALEARMGADNARDYLQANGAPQFVIRAPVGGGTTTDSNLGTTGLYGVVLGDFTDVARTSSAVARISADNSFIKLPFLTRAAVMTSAPSAALTAESKGAVVSKIQLNNVLLAPAKINVLVVVSDALLRALGPAAQTTFNKSLVNAIGAALDSAFTATISSGLSAITSTGPLADVRAALTAVTSSEQQKLYWLADPLTCKLGSTLGQTRLQFEATTAVGGEMCGLPLIAASGLSPGTLLLVDAQQIAVALDAPTVDVSAESDVEMSSTPTGASDVPTATTMVNMFSADSVALKAGCFFACQRLRSTAAAIVTGISNSTWSST